MVESLHSGISSHRSYVSAGGCDSAAEERLGPGNSVMLYFVLYADKVCRDQSMGCIGLTFDPLLPSQGPGCENMPFTESEPWLSRTAPRSSQAHQRPALIWFQFPLLLLMCGHVGQALNGPRPRKGAFQTLG